MENNGGAGLLNTQLAIGLTLLLLALLALREVARMSPGPRWQALTRALAVAATPIIVIFIAMVAIRIINALR